MRMERYLQKKRKRRGGKHSQHYLIYSRTLRDASCVCEYKIINIIYIYIHINMFANILHICIYTVHTHSYTYPYPCYDVPCQPATAVAMHSAAPSTASQSTQSKCRVSARMALKIRTWDADLHLSEFEQNNVTLWIMNSICTMSCVLNRDYSRKQMWVWFQRLDIVKRP